MNDDNDIPFEKRQLLEELFAWACAGYRDTPLFHLIKRVHNSRVEPIHLGEVHPVLGRLADISCEKELQHFEHTYKGETYNTVGGPWHDGNYIIGQAFYLTGSKVVADIGYDPFEPYVLVWNRRKRSFDFIDCGTVPATADEKKAAIWRMCAPFSLMQVSHEPAGADERLS